MVNADEARDALDEIHGRQRQVAAVVARRSTPWWYIAGLAGVLLAIAVYLDLRTLNPGWAGWLFQYVIPLGAAAIAVALGFAVYRSAGLRPRGAASRSASTLLLLAGGAFLLSSIAAGTILRASRVSWDTTIATVIGLLVALVTGAVWRGLHMAHRTAPTDLDG